MNESRSSRASGNGRDGRKELGRWGEEQAAKHLSAIGLTIVERNWRARSGEIDIIAEDKGTLVFVEVRTRRATGRFGTAEESVDVRKIRQVRETALLYLHMSKKHGSPCRFDVIAITADDRTEPDGRKLRHIPNAF